MPERIYITRQGARKLAAELNELLRVTRPKVVSEVADAAAHGDRSENAEYKYGKKRLREIDRRLRFLTKRLDQVEVVNVEELSGDVVRFGAFVSVETEEGQCKTYQLVGPDETEPEAGKISYTSPLGRALLRRRVGDVAVLQRPKGDMELEILDVAFK